MQQPLTDRHKRAILLLASGFSKRETGDRVGVQLGTIYAWCKRDDFQQELNFLRNFATTVAKGDLKGMLGLGLSNLRELLADEDKAVKYRATELLFKTTLGNRVVESLGEGEDGIVTNMVQKGLDKEGILYFCFGLIEKITGISWKEVSDMIAPKKPSVEKRPRQLAHDDDLEVQEYDGDKPVEERVRIQESHRKT